MPHSMVSFRMTLSDLEKLNEIFNDTKASRGLSATAEQHVFETSSCFCFLSFVVTLGRATTTDSSNGSTVNK